VDLQERHQLDAARLQVAKVKARTRPWRYIFAIVLALVAAAVSVEARSALAANSGSVLTPLGKSGNTALSYGSAVAFCLLAGAGTIGLGNKAREVLERTVGSAHAAVVRFAVIVVGGLLTIVITLELLNIAITQLLVGGALTGVVVGIAAQQSLANIFAGIVLLMARPFRVGDQVGIRSGALSGLIEGTVTEISITYVSLHTPKGPVHVPNSQVLAAAVGPAGAVPSPLAPAAPPPGAAASPAGPTAPPAGPAATSASPPAPPAGLAAPPASSGAPPAGLAALSAGPGAPPADAGGPPAGPDPGMAALAGAAQAAAGAHTDSATPAPPGTSGVAAGPSGPAQPEPSESGSGRDSGHQPS
jgi:Mechanosensitive ion channel